MVSQELRELAENRKSPTVLDDELEKCLKTMFGGDQASLDVYFMHLQPTSSHISTANRVAVIKKEIRVQMMDGTALAHPDTRSSTAVVENRNIIYIRSESHSTKVFLLRP